MSVLLWIVLITTVAGVGGTGLGGYVGAVLRRDSTKVISLLLAFAGGVMMAIVCFDLIPEAFHPPGAGEPFSVWFVSAGVILGFVVVYLLNLWIDRVSNPELSHIDAHHPRTADNIDELIHADHFNMHRHRRREQRQNRGLFVAGVVMATAIALHNMPEGMVIGSTYAADSSDLTSGSGFAIAIVIALHNIPEGMAVSVPLISGGMGKAKAVAITALSGAPTVLGAVIGYKLGLISPLWLSLSLSFAGGAMLYVVFCELFPESFLHWQSKAPGAMALVGALTGMFIVYL